MLHSSGSNTYYNKTDLKYKWDQILNLESELFNKPQYSANLSSAPILSSKASKSAAFKKHTVSNATLRVCSNYTSPLCNEDTLTKGKFFKFQYLFSILSDASNCTKILLGDTTWLILPCNSLLQSALKSPSWTDSMSVGIKASEVLEISSRGSSHISLGFTSVLSVYL